jgi:capsular polysaccharide transport system permease protein
VVVRKATDDSVPSVGLTSLLGGGNQQSIEDARYLKTYLTSPQVLEDLEKTIDFRSAYARKGIDFFPGVSKDASREDVFEVFRKQISVNLSEVSGELTIQSFAFDSGMALKLNRFLISQSEEFVNKLNQDVYLRQVDFAQKQVNVNADRVKQASLKVEEFQESNRILDVESVAKGSEQFIAALEGELAKKRVELATLKRRFSDPMAPEIESVDAQVQELQVQILNERRALVSSSGKNLNAKALKLTELESNLLFATDLYKGALAAAEKTRVDSQQQQRFMAVLSKPLLPESPWQYWRHKGFLTAIGILFVVYSFFRFFKSMFSNRN